MHLSRSTFDSSILTQQEQVPHDLIILNNNKNTRFCYATLRICEIFLKTNAGYSIVKRLNREELNKFYYY